MRLIRLSTNANTAIHSINSNVLKLYTKVAMGPLKYNKKPLIEIHPNNNISDAMNDIDNSMRICFNHRPYKIYYIANEFHPNPKLVYMKHWIDTREDEVKGLCVMEYIDYEQINFCKYRAKNKMDGMDLDFMFMLCESLKHF